MNTHCPIAVESLGALEIDQVLGACEHPWFQRGWSSRLGEAPTGEAHAFNPANLDPLPVLDPRGPPHRCVVVPSGFLRSY